MIDLLRKFKYHSHMTLRKIFFNLCSVFFKINNKKILFDNFLGKGFGDNPKYIAEQFLNSDFNLVWLVSDLRTEMPPKIKKVKYGSLTHIYELATSKFWIDNVKHSLKIKKRTGQIYIQTWHGGLGLKKIEKSVENKLDPGYVKQSKSDSKLIDVFLSDCDFFTNKIIPDFWYNGKVLHSGFPRNDVFFRENSFIRNKVYSYFGIKSKKKKIVLYAPTFRNDHNTDVYNFNYMKVLNTCRKKFNEDYVIVIRLHPNVSSKGNFIKYDESVIDGTNYPDMQELLAASDILISDYSSCMFDFMLKNGKTFIFARDYLEYKKNEREFLFDIKQLPFPFATCERELINNIENFDNTKFMNSCNAFLKDKGLIENGSSSKNVADFIKKSV